MSNPSGPGDFCPITVSPVLLHLFSKLVLSHLAEGNTSHKFQSGFSDDRSTSSNILILQALMRLTKKSQRPLFAVSLDLRKASKSVSHEAIFAALEARKVPLRTQSLVCKMYTNASTVFWSGGVSDGVRVRMSRGIKQGDPLSPFIFNCVLDLLMEQLNSTALGVKLSGGCTSASAFADDILLLSDSFEGLQALVRHTEDYFHNVDLSINPSKSQYFGWRVNPDIHCPL